MAIQNPLMTGPAAISLSRRCRLQSMLDSVRKRAYRDNAQSAASNPREFRRIEAATAFVMCSSTTKLQRPDLLVS